MTEFRKNLVFELGTMLWFAYPVSPHTIFGMQVSYAVGALPIGVAIGDFNLDRKQDVVTANYNSHTVLVLLVDQHSHRSASLLNYLGSYEYEFMFYPYFYPRLFTCFILNINIYNAI
jgi:hypothetical protein